MTVTLKALSILLSYPGAEMRDAMPVLARAVRTESLIAEPQLSKLLAFVADLRSYDLYDLQERYVLLFDRSRSLSLHLFEHVHGESRDRGQAMVDLLQLYERHGLFLEAKELPDYLPLFLEFLSTLPLADARDLLGETLHIVTALKERLKRRRSAYAVVFRAIELVANGKADARDIQEILTAPDDNPDDLAALDRAWEEAPVTFAPDQTATVAPGGGCPAARDTLSRMDVPIHRAGGTEAQRNVPHEGDGV